MADLILLPTLEQLHPYGTYPDVAMGTVFSVAAGSPYPTGAMQAWAAAFLKPWSWAAGNLFLPIEAWQFYADIQGTWTSLGPSRPVDPGTAGALDPEGLRQLRTRLDDRFRLFAAQAPGEPFVFPAAQPVRAELRPWPPFVADVSLWPWPLAQALGLSFFHRLDFTAQASKPLRLAAVPVLRMQDPQGAAVAVPGGAPVLGQDPRTVEIAYDVSLSAAPDLAIRAITVPLSLDKPPASAFIDLGSLWVKNGGGADGVTAQEDWRQGLEARLATQLCPARLILDWLRDQLSAKSSPASYPRVGLQVLGELCRASLPTFGEGFLGGKLLRRIAAALPDGPYPASDIDDLERHAASWFGAIAAPSPPATWLGWVATQSSLPVVTLADLQRMTVQEMVAQLDHLLADLTAPALCGAVFAQAWRAFSPPDGSVLSPGEMKLVAALQRYGTALQAPDPAQHLDLALELLRARVGKQLLDQGAGDVFQGPTLAENRKSLAAAAGRLLRGLGLPASSAPDWQRWCDQKARQIAETVLPTATATASAGGAACPPRDASVRATRGITVQVDTLAADPGADDRLADVQGVALLMRRDGTGPWHCLNLAAASLGTQTVAASVLRPTRLAYVAGLRAPTLTYDNEPLSVGGPLTDSRAAGVEIGPAASGAPIDVPLLEFHYSPAARLPELRFGHRYEIVPFAVTNSGAVPPALASGAPWGLKTNISSLASPGAAAAPAPRTVSYLRQAHVGALRIVSPASAGFPPIPPRVAPRIRELNADSILPSCDPLLTGAKAETAADSALAGTPLLLLGEARGLGKAASVASAFRFQVAAPTIDLKTWDRWVGGILDRERRKKVWETVYEATHDLGGTSRQNLVDAGIYLDDPAVGSLHFELVSRLDGTPKTLGSLNVAPPPRSAASTGPGVVLRAQQSEALDVECKLVDGRLAVSVAVAGRQLGALVAPPDAADSGLYRLSVYAILAAGAASRFQSPEGVRADISDATSPWHLFVEVVQPLPQGLEDRMHGALKPDPQAAAAGRLKVELDLSAMGSLQRHLYRAELWHQQWGWRGRPPALPPDLDRGAQQIDFEMSEFGARGDDEHRLLAMRRGRPGSPQAFTFLYDEDFNAGARRGDPRALYHRVSACAFSRYEGVLPDRASRVEAVDRGTGDRWQRLFMPCRFHGDVPAPKIKLILPLTQEAPGDAGRGPGLLVVTDGGWHEVGGLAERLDVEVTSLTSPTDGQQYYQAGTDPVVTTASARERLYAAEGEPAGTAGGGSAQCVALQPGGVPAPAAGALPVADFTVCFAPAVGAIGHFRGRAADTPRFQASSFLLSPPVVTARPPAGGRTVAPVPVSPDLSWWFFQLRFYRTLRMPAGPDRRSAASAAFWVQLLPPVGTLDKLPLGASPLRVTAPQDKPVFDGAAPRARPAFQVFGVLTWRITGLDGRPGQEGYLGVLWLDAAQRWTSDCGAGGEVVKAASNDKLLVRWIEVQSAEGVVIRSRGDELWARLFEADQPDVRRARIVRISNPVAVQAGSPS